MLKDRSSISRPNVYIYRSQIIKKDAVIRLLSHSYIWDERLTDCYPHSLPFSVR